MNFGRLDKNGNQKEKVNMSDKQDVGSDSFVPEIVQGQVVPLEEIPGAVCNCLKSLSNLEQKVKAATDRAISAQGQADSAASVKLAWWKIGDKAAAIESLQSAMTGMSKAQIDQSEAMKAMLEYQRAISKAMQFLLGLGVGSLNANRTVYRAIEMQMRGASAEALDEMARQELKNTLAQLKSQQDILEQQERTKTAVKQNQKSIKDINKLDEEQEKELARQRDKDGEHDARLDAQIGMIHKLEQEILKLKGEDPMQGARIFSEDEEKLRIDKIRSNDCVPEVRRKWCRSSDEGLIAGVCAGVARGLHINIWGFRILYIVGSVFLWLVPVVFYFIAMFVLKPMPTKEAGKSNELVE